MRHPQAIAKAEAVRGNAARLASAPTLLPMQAPGHEGLGRADAPRPEREPCRSRGGLLHPEEGKSAARDLTGPRSARLARVGGHGSTARQAALAPAGSIAAR